MAERLFDKGGGETDLMVSSPAVRALSTVRIFAEIFGYPESAIEEKGDLSKEGTAENMASVVRALPDSLGSVMLFGCKSTISKFVS